MCDPVSLTVTAMAVTAAATGVSAYGQKQQAKAKEKMYEYQADASNSAAEAARKQATEQEKLIESTKERNIQTIQTEASIKAHQLSLQVSRYYGAQKAAMGQLGIKGTTAEAIITDTFDKAQQDQALIRYNADIASWKVAEDAKGEIYTVQQEARNKEWALKTQANQYSMAAKTTKKAGNIAVATTLLEGAASMLMIGSEMFPGGGGGKTANIEGMGEVGVAPDDYWKSAKARF